jgi:hypothetical protein
VAGVGNADRGDIGLAGRDLTLAPRDRCWPGSLVPMRSTMSLVAVWEAGADSHQPSTVGGRLDQGRTVGGRADQGRPWASRGSGVDRGRADQGRPWASRGSGVDRGRADQGIGVLA